MGKRAIVAGEWPSYLEKFALRHKAWLATVEERPRQGSARVCASNRPLESLTAEPLGAGMRIVIGFGDAGDTLRVEPAHALRVEETPRGEELGLEIETPRGETIMRFRTAVLPEEVDGIAPWQL